ncbi:YfiR family protein [Aliikangiella maris]|uniref:YfiR family protein n=2 Tax=Aliikangiella maris TaxID=3162458 RepID=A0ABV3MSA1_9GAMM
MVRILLLFFILLPAGSALFASTSERLNKDLAKSLIIRQLLNLVEWDESRVMQKTADDYLLCTYNDTKNAKVFNQYLKGIKIQGRTLTIANRASREQLSMCHAAFMEQPEQGDVDWILSHQLTKNTLFIIEGSQYVTKGFHIGLYLNSQNTFDYELNPDALISSHLIPSRELLKYAKVVASEIADKVNLLRSLINYTEWAESSIKFEKSEEFNLCTFDDHALAAFITYFGDSKTFKGKSLSNRSVKSASQMADCHALIMNNVQDERLVNIIAQRAQQRILLIGNDDALGEKGVHYNLVPKKNQQHLRFEINLVAFKQTGHSPRFELFNSGVVVDKDYPELSRMLFNILVDTTWPKNAANSDNSSIRLCVYEKEPVFENIKLFLSAYQINDRAKSHKQVEVNKITKPTQLNRCQAFLVGDITAKELSELLVDKSQLALLVIAYQLKNGSRAYHYKLKSQPKEILIELDLDKLKMNGFIPAQALLDSVKASEGGEL